MMNDSTNLKSESAMELCRSCGLCCDGTLFSGAPLEFIDNLAKLEAASIQILMQDEQHYFKQPCPAHCDKGCGIYDDRPKICQQFYCKLLIDEAARDISAWDAHALINQAQALKKTVQESLRCTDASMTEISLAQLWKQWNNSTSAEQGQIYRRQHGVVFMQMAALRRFLDKHFVLDNWCEMKGLE